MASVWLQRAKVATTKIFKSTSSYFLDLALWGQSIQIHTACPHQSYHVLLDLNADPGEERWLSKLYDVWDCSDCSGLGWNQSKCVWESSGWRWGLLNGLLEIGNLVIVWFGTMIESPCWLTAMEIKLLASAVKNNAPFATGVPDSRNAQRLLELNWGLHARYRSTAFQQHGLGDARTLNKTRFVESAFYWNYLFLWFWVISKSLEGQLAYHHSHC